MIGILCAMREEAELIIQEYQLEKCDDSHFEVYQKGNITLLISKIGKVYAALGTQWLIREYAVDTIINIGLAGGLKKEFAIGKVFLGGSIIQHDVYLPWEGEHLNYLKKAILLEKEVQALSSLDISQGIILTGDQFIDEYEKSEKLSEIGDIVDMESFAVASACHVFQVPCFVLKAISDNANDEAAGNFDENIEKAMRNSIPILKEVIRVLKK